MGWLVIATTVSLYMLYEFMHFCCHIDENRFVRYCPFVNTIRRHHAAHHDQSIMMERNMNLTFPIADWMFGTSDLDRGLLGHLFNGYSTKYVKTDMRQECPDPEGEGTLSGRWGGRQPRLRPTRPRAPEEGFACLAAAPDSGAAAARFRAPHAA